MPTGSRSCARWYSRTCRLTLGPRLSYATHFSQCRRRVGRSCAPPGSAAAGRWPPAAARRAPNGSPARACHVAPSIAPIALCNADFFGARNGSTPKRCTEGESRSVNSNPPIAVAHQMHQHRTAQNGFSAQKAAPVRPVALLVILPRSEARHR